MSTHHLDADSPTTRLGPPPTTTAAGTAPTSTAAAAGTAGAVGTGLVAVNTTAPDVGVGLIAGSVAGVAVVIAELTVAARRLGDAADTARPPATPPPVTADGVGNPVLAAALGRAVTSTHRASTALAGHAATLAATLTDAAGAYEDTDHTAATTLRRSADPTRAPNLTMAAVDARAPFPPAAPDAGFATDTISSGVGVGVGTGVGVGRGVVGLGEARGVEDLIAGDPEALGEIGDWFTARARTLEEAVGVASVRTDAVWTGQAAEAFRAELGGWLSDAARCADLCQGLAGIVAEYQAALVAARTQAGTALDLYQRALRQYRQASRPDLAQVSNADYLRRQAQAAMTRAQRTLDTARDELNSQAGPYRSALDAITAILDQLTHRHDTATRVPAGPPTAVAAVDPGPDSCAEDQPGGVHTPPVCHHRHPSADGDSGPRTPPPPAATAPPAPQAPPPTVPPAPQAPPHGAPPVAGATRLPESGAAATPPPQPGPEPELAPPGVAVLGGDSTLHDLGGGVVVSAALLATLAALATAAAGSPHAAARRAAAPLLRRLRPPATPTRSDPDDPDDPAAPGVWGGPADDKTGEDRDAGLVVIDAAITGGRPRRPRDPGPRTPGHTAGHRAAARGDEGSGDEGSGDEGGGESVGPLLWELAASAGLGVAGPGGVAAVRALLLEAVTAQPPARILLTTREAAALLGPTAAGTLSTHPAVTVADTPEAVLDLAEAQLLTRARLTVTPARLTATPDHPDATDYPDATDQPGEATGPLVIVTGDGAHRGRLAGLITTGAPLGSRVLLLGPWPGGVTCHISHGGRITATTRDDPHDLVGTHTATVPSSVLGQVLRLGGHTPPPGGDHRTAPDTATSSDAVRVPTEALSQPGLSIRDRLNPRPDTPVASPPPVGIGARGGLEVTTLPPAAPGDQPVLAVTPPSPAQQVAGDRPVTIRVLGVPRVWWHPDPTEPATADAAAGGPGVESREITGLLAPRALESLVLLAVHPGGTTREALVAALWGQDPPARPTNALHTALSRLRHALSTATGGAVGEVVTVGAGRYQLDADLVAVDYWGLAAAVAARRAAATDPARISAYRRIVATYTGPLGEGMTADWIPPVREAIRRDALDAVAALARCLVDTDPAATLELLETAREFDPHNELLYRDIMRLQARLGYLDAIARTSALLTTRLAEIDARPSAATLELATRLQHRHDPDLTTPPPDTGERGPRTTT